MTRDRAYLDFLKAECRCAVCKKLGVFNPDCRIVDPAHTSNNGGSSKGPDDEALPLGRFHHQEQHQIGVPAFEAKYGIDLKREGRVHYTAYQVWKETQ